MNNEKCCTSDLKSSLSPSVATFLRGYDESRDYQPIVPLIVVHSRNSVAEKHLHLLRSTSGVRNGWPKFAFEVVGIDIGSGIVYEGVVVVELIL